VFFLFIFIVSAQFKDVSYAFHSTLYTYVIESSIIHRRSYEGFHIKAEKLYKTGICISYFSQLVNIRNVLNFNIKKI